MNRMELNDIQIELLENYCSNNMSNLKKICKFVWGNKGIPNYYHDDLYSDAMKVLLESINTYDSNSNTKFITYLTNNIKLSYREWYRDNYLRAKRNNIKFDENGKIEKDENGNPVIISNISLDAPSEEGINLVEKISSYSIEERVFLNELSENTSVYLSKLTPLQKHIAYLIMCGYKLREIKYKLNLTNKQFTNQLKFMRCFENTNLLNVKKNTLEEPLMKEEKVEQTFEKSKIERYSIASIIKKMKNGTLRYDHPLQRATDQHSIKMKSNLISDILQGNPIPGLVFAEQVINGISIIWNLDGKQRSTNIKEFSEDKFKISKNVRRNLIKYQSFIKDENNNTIFENGFPKAQWAEFDISNKKFSQLPSELQDKFMDYCFDVTLYLNCSNEDIAYHIERYNDGKQMGSSQKGLIKLGEDFARKVREISNMQFFCENGFNFTQKKNGTIDRVCMEAIMATDFIDSWKTSPEDIANFLKINATEENFDELQDTVERLENIVTEDIGELFDKKDTFIYFTAFSNFKHIKQDDNKFIEFLSKYGQYIQKKFVEIEEGNNGKKRSTKDKSVIMEKIMFITDLMNKYFNLELETNKENKMTVENFISEAVDIPFSQVEENLECYQDDLKILKQNNIKFDSKLQEQENDIALLAIIAYGYKNDITIDNWMEKYSKKTTVYSKNPKESFELMKKDLNDYIKKFDIA